MHTYDLVVDYSCFRTRVTHVGFGTSVVSTHLSGSVGRSLACCYEYPNTCNVVGSSRPGEGERSIGAAEVGDSADSVHY